MLAVPLQAEAVRRFRDNALAAMRPTGDEVVADAARIDLIAEAEKLKNALSALQAELAVDLDASTRSRNARQGVRPELQGRGVASQIALARQESPHRGGMLLGLAKDLTTDLPCTLRALREGRLNEYRATVVARETGCLGREDRAIIDEEVCGTDLLDGLGTGQLGGELRRRVQAADPAAVARRNAKANEERRVSVRPTPDTMVYLTGLLPVGPGVSAFAALDKEASRLICEGDDRTRGQIMADLLVERITGQSSAERVGVNLDVIISDQTLLAGGNNPAVIPGWGPVPAQLAREIIANATQAALSDETVSWIRSLYADPSGRLIAMTSKQRLVAGALADLLRIRDQGICRTPWCDAPIRHADHVTPVAAGGQTTETNTQGLCIACNHTKQADGWTQTVIDDPAETGGRHTVETTTPTGHRHRSRAPAPPTPARPRRRLSGATYHPAVDIDLAADYTAA